MSGANSGTGKVEIAFTGAVAVLTLNDPKTLNALDERMAADLDCAIVEAASRARAIVLTGAGRSFCSGGGLNALIQGDADFGRSLETHMNPLMSRLRDLPLPWIAAVRGAAVGAGCSLALAADLILASEDAYFIQGFVRVGLVPDSGATHLLARGATRARAMELMLLGDKLPAARALDWGLINRMTPSEQLDEAAMELATRLASGPTQTYALTRKAAWRALDGSWAEALDLERRLQAEVSGTHDAREGIASFLEKRPARFLGR